MGMCQATAFRTASSSIIQCVFQKVGKIEETVLIGNIARIVFMSYTY